MATPAIEASHAPAMQLLPAVELHSRTVLLDDRPDGRSLTIFHSYCETFGRRWCATRRVVDGVWSDSSVEFDGQRLDYGEDPRIFVHAGRPAIVAAVSLPGHELRNHLYELDGTGFERNILLPPKSWSPGKNWSPISCWDGKIRFVHSFDPPTILIEERRERGVIVLAAHIADSTVSEMGPGGFSAYRGGSNGVWADGFYIGIGHTTRYRPGQTSSATAELGFDHLYHRPFGWILDRTTRRMQLFDVVGAFPPEFDVIDPTSLIAHGGGSFEVFTTEVSRHFHDANGRRQVVSYRFQLDAAFRHKVVHGFLLRRLPASLFIGHQSIMKNGIWHCPLAGEARFVISGPYVTLEPGHYEAIFDVQCLAARGDHSFIAVDVTAGATRVLTQSIWRPLGARAERDELTVRFLHDRPADPLEFRVAVSGFESGELRFTEVRCGRLDEIRSNPT